MKDKVVIITGANSGIGKASAIKFAQEGYSVLMACRCLDKGKKVQQEIISLTNNNNIDLFELDISSFESIRRFCSDFKNKYKKLDVLINNAGYFNYNEKKYQLSCDNIELSFATNTVGPYYMTQLLKCMLKKSDSARVVNACNTNIRHFFDAKREIEFDNLHGEHRWSRPYNPYKMYGDSKMALLMLTFKMAEELKESSINVNAVQISAIKMSKETMQKFKYGWRIAAMIQSALGDSPETIADTYFNICTSEDFKDVSGKLISDKREIVKPTFYTNGLIQDIKQLFDKKVYPEYADNVENINKAWKFCYESSR